MNDNTLLEAVRGGDRVAFSVIIERHQRSVYGYLRARLLEPADADDLTQETFLRCYQSKARFDSPVMARPWLLGIARNLLREHVRRSKRRKEVAWTELCLQLDALIDVQSARHEGAMDHLPGCLEELGPSAREAIDLRYRLECRLEEIGERLHRSEGAVKLLMFRARQALRLCLETKLQGRHD